jgi:hypothetical protein
MTTASSWSAPTRSALTEVVRGAVGFDLCRRRRRR